MPIVPSGGNLLVSVSPQTGTDSGPGSETIDRDELFEVLSNQRRRFTLHYLKQSESRRVDLSDLSTQVAAWEENVPPAEIRYEDRKSVHTALAQFHLPKMCDAGVVEYNAGRKTVELTEDGDDLTVYLEPIEGDEIPWSVYFVSVAVFASATIFGVLVDVPGLAAFTPVDISVFVTGAFLLSSIAFLYDSRARMLLGSDGTPPDQKNGGG